MSDRLTIAEGDKVEYAGNWEFSGTVVESADRSIVVEADDGNQMNLDPLDCRRVDAGGD